MTNTRCNLLGLTLFCLALGCGGNSSEEEPNQPDDNGSSGVSGSLSNAGASGSTETSGTGGLFGFVQEPEPLSCGGTQCTELEPTDGGVPNILTLGLQYCCTPTDQCSVQLLGATACPDKVFCGGIECQSFVTDLGTLVGAGTVCCSPSQKCSVMGPGETDCPEPDVGDPDCPSVADSFGQAVGDMFEQGGFGGQGCCLPDNTCGVIFIGNCIGNALAETFPDLFGAPVYDCDGNLVEPIVEDAGMPADAGSNTDAANSDVDSGT